MKQVEIAVLVSVPESATKQDIEDYFSVEICGFNSYKQTNPCHVEGVEFDDITVNQ